MGLDYNLDDLVNIYKLNNVSLSEEDIKKIEALPSYVKIYQRDVMSLPYYTLNTTKMNEVRKSPIFRIVMRGKRNFINGDVQYDKYSLLILCLFYNNPVCQAEICCDKEDLTEIEFLFKYGKSKNDVFLGDDVFSVDRDSMPLTIEEIEKYVSPFSNSLYNKDWKEMVKKSEENKEKLLLANKGVFC